MLTNPITRRLLLLINNNFLPIIIKLFIIGAIIFTLSITTYSLLNPEFGNNLYQKIYSKLRIKNLVNDYPYQINISGNKRISKSRIINIIKTIKQEDRNQQIHIQDIIDKVNNKIPWITDIVINRNLPNILNITIKEFEPFAIWYNEKEKFIIDKDGKMIKHQEEIDLPQMIQLSGYNANIYIKSLFNLLTIEPELSKKIYSATWVGNRRWDIRFENNLIIKLPQNNLSKAWKKLIDIYSLPGAIIDLEVIDLRIDDKIFLKYNNKAIKEITN